MKKLRLVRDTFTDNSTIGKLYIDDVYFSEVLEDKDRGLDQSLTVEENKRLKVYGETCVPYGKYKGTVSMSMRMKRVLPLLFNVPAFDGIRIHRGNTKKDTLGCIEVGSTRGVDIIYNSKITESKLVELMPEGTEFEIEIVKAKI